MLDTVSLNLYGLQEHSDICRNLIKIKKGKVKYNVEEWSGTLEHEIIELSTEEGAKDYSHKFVYKTRFQPSSHYKVIFFIKPAEDCLSIEFSIPKFFYGTNIIQAVTNPIEGGEVFLKGTTDTLDYQIQKSFKRFRVYVKSFFSLEFPGLHVNYDNLEIRRLDLCFNQVFGSKKQALDYLQLQKTIKRKYFRENNSDANNYKTAVFFKNDDYSFKIYHKGTEYAKTDRKKHEQINAKQDKEVFDVDYLQSFADKILRYEMTFRHTYISYLFNQKVFRNESKNFTKFRKLYNAIKGSMDRWKKSEWNEQGNGYEIIRSVHDKFKGVTLSNYHADITQFLFDWYTKKVNDYEPSKNEVWRAYRRFYEDFDTLMNTRRRTYFNLSNPDYYLFEEDNLSNKNFFHTEKKILFTKELFYEMADKFKGFIYDMEIKEKQTTTEYLKRIDEYNSGIEKDKHIDKLYRFNPALKPKQKRTKIDKCKLGLVLTALENYDLSDLQNILGFTRQTMYNYKKQLVLIGFNKNTVSLTHDIVTDLTFGQYFYECIFNQNKLFNTNMSLRLDFSKDFKNQLITA